MIGRGMNERRFDAKMSPMGDSRRFRHLGRTSALALISTLPLCGKRRTVPISVDMALQQNAQSLTFQIEAFVPWLLDLLGVHVAPPVTTPEQ